jgi:hypothetical protein
MNKQKKKGGKAASKGLAAAYVTYESSQKAGTLIIRGGVSYSKLIVVAL